MSVKHATLPAGHDYTRTIVVKATPAVAFAAINNVRGWWDGEIDGKTDGLGDVFDYRHADIHYSKQEIVELVPDRRVTWRVLEAKLNFLADPTEWTGTTITFDIVPRGETTEIVFTHQGLKPEIECYDSCSDAWNGLIGRSLKALVESGQGVRTLSGQ
jgi:hypothetical protein